jgi:hypothetical protein
LASATASRLVRRPRNVWARLLVGVPIAAFWLAGSAVVTLAQSGHERKVAAAASAGAGIAIILAATVLTADPGRRYFRSLLGTLLAVSLTASWLVRKLVAPTGAFGDAPVVERIVIPLVVVLLLPLAVYAHRGWLLRLRALSLRTPRPMDWVFVAYPTLVAVPALALGLAHHNRPLYIAQDIGLVVFFVFMYAAGRAVPADAARASAIELIEVLLLLTVAQLVLLQWGEVEPLYIYMEATYAGALAWVILQPRHIRFLTVGLAIVLLVTEAYGINAPGAGSSVAVDLGVAFGLLLYVVLRIRRFIPQWLIVGLALVALVGFVGFTPDGAAIRGQYQGPDPSNRGRTFESDQVRKAISKSTLSLALGRGFGSTIDEQYAPPSWKRTLRAGGRDLAAVQEIHPLPYLFLLKAGIVGLVWLFAFILGLAYVAVRGLERAARGRDPSFVIYAVLPMVSLVQAFAGATRLMANPLNALTIGILVSALAVPAAAAQPEVEPREAAPASAAS